MDVRQLRYFLAVATHLSYSRAAKEVYLTPQALRQAVRRIETELHTQLFVSDSRGLALTRNGEQFRDYASCIVSDFDHSIYDAQSLFHFQETLTVAISPSVLGLLFPLLPNLLSFYQHLHQGLTLHVKKVDDCETLPLLEKNKIDLAFVSMMPHKSADYDFHTIHSFRLGLTIPPKHPLALSEQLSLSDLEGETIFGSSSLEFGFHPLFQDMKQSGIHFNYEAIPDPVSIFCRATEENALVFTGIDLQTNNALASFSVPLEKYELSFCAVHPSGNLFTPSQRLLLRHLSVHLPFALSRGIVYSSF